MGMTSNFEQSVLRLYEFLKNEDWLQSIGEGDNEIFVYCTEIPNDEDIKQIKEQGWFGYKTTFQVIGEVKPL